MAQWNNISTHFNCWCLASRLNRWRKENIGSYLMIISCNSHLFWNKRSGSFSLNSNVKIKNWIIQKMLKSFLSMNYLTIVLFVRASYNYQSTNFNQSKWNNEIFFFIGIKMGMQFLFGENFRMAYIHLWDSGRAKKEICVLLLAWRWMFGIQKCSPHKLHFHAYQNKKVKISIFHFI